MKNIILILSSFFLFSCSDIYQPAVVSARKEATQIGLEIMKNGGNAYDAMIATHLALQSFILLLEILVEVVSLCIITKMDLVVL